MRSRMICVVATLLAISAIACRESDEVVSPGSRGSIEVSSDPAGASIELDNVATGRVTPATFWDLTGRHDILVRLERDAIAYGYRTQVQISGDSLHRVNGPLMFRCVTTTCLFASARARDLGRLRIMTQANGALMFREGAGEGLRWPLGSTNSYASMGMPLIAMVSGARDTLALGIYDYDYLAGRPEPVFTSTAERTTFRQPTWIVPPTNILLTGAPTVRGIEVQEELIGAANSDVVYLKLTFTNITNRDSYRAADPLVPNSGLTFSQVYLGFGLDADIGDADDDLITYEPTLDLVYVYDSNFREDMFNTTNASSPGLVGVKLVEKPENTNAILNAWPSTFGQFSGDWRGGVNEPVGHSILSGARSFLPDEPGEKIGHTPGVVADYRISVTAGPVTLAPGQTASVTIAIIMALPVSGQYVAGQTVLPGSPTVQDRPIRRIAATLLEAARTAIAQ
jgi:hypothetical protein